MSLASHIKIKARPGSGTVSISVDWNGFPVGQDVPVADVERIVKALQKAMVSAALNEERTFMPLKPGETT